MTNQIVSLSEAKLLELFPGYFDAAVFSGTWRSNNTLLTGDASNNKIAGLTGMTTEKYEGTSGNDVITAGPAPSRSGAFAEFGNGDYGDDFLTGNLDHDVLVGGKGDNTIYGGFGNDYLYGDGLRIALSLDPSSPSTSIVGPIRQSGDGNDLLYGGGGNDFIHGGGGDVNLLQGGRDGNDTLIGDGSGRDVLDGGPGDDYLKSSGHAHFTTMIGGAGNDVFDITQAGEFVPLDPVSVKILDFYEGDKIKLPPSDSIAVLYEMVDGQSGVDWDWEWVATETDHGVTIPLDDAITLYLPGVDFDDLTIGVSAGTFEMT